MIESFINRMGKIGIKVELFANYPWVYLHKVNGNLVTEKYCSEHGFTVFMGGGPMMDIGKTFKLIRKYVEKNTPQKGQ